jgi:hypothetical protein
MNNKRKLKEYYIPNKITKYEDEFCIHIECNEIPYYNYIKETKPLYCIQHKLPNMINVKSNICIDDECINYPNETIPIYHEVHKLEKMINFNNTLSENKFSNCSSRESKNIPSNIIKTKNNMCIYKGCKLTASFNYVGRKRRLYCKSHKLEGMDYVSILKCAHENCKTLASFNYPGQTKKLYCAQHKLEGMIITHKIKCIHNNCEIVPSFNYPGEIKKLYCNAHKLLNMVNVKIYNRGLKKTTKNIVLSENYKSDETLKLNKISITDEIYISNCVSQELELLFDIN